MKPPAKQKEEMIGKEAYRQISYVVVGDYAGELSEVWGDDEGVWKSLDAVKNARVFFLDPDLIWATARRIFRLPIIRLCERMADRSLFLSQE